MKRKKKWMRMLAATAFAVILALPFRAAADETHVPVDLEQKCSLAVSIAAGLTDFDYDVQLSGINWSGVNVELYRVAGVEKAGSSDDYTYVSSGTGDPFEDIIKDANLSRKGEMTAEEWDALAQRAVQVIRGPQGGSPLTASYTGNVRDGVGDIDAGLYVMLIRDPGSGFKDVTMEDGSESIATVVRSNNYEYEFAPSLVSLPVHEELRDTAGNYTGYRWNYGALISPKYGISYRYGSLMLAKTLEGYRTGEPATFVFEVKSTYSDGRAGAEFECDKLVTFYYDENSSATQVETLDIPFPIGAQVTVTEIYSGSSYSLTAGSPADQNATIAVVGPTIVNGINVPADTQLVQFTNVYNASGNRGGAVENSFENSGSQWTWTQTTVDSSGTTTTGPVVQQPVVTPTTSTSPEPSTSPTPAGN